jgi:hypothetical protein
MAMGPWHAVFASQATTQPSTFHTSQVSTPTLQPSQTPTATSTPTAAATGSHNVQQPSATPTAAATHGSAPTPTPTKTATPTPSPTATPPPAFYVQITPTSLSPKNCESETQDYRCTLELVVSANNNGTLSWNTNCLGMPAQFNPAANTISLNGQIVSTQVIVYIIGTTDTQGSLVFTFTGYGQTLVVKVNWST